MLVWRLDDRSPMFKLKHRKIMKKKSINYWFSAQKLSIGIICLCFLAFGCTKEITNDVVNENIQSLDALQLLSDKNDIENHNINKLLYLFTHAIKEASLTPPLLEDIEKAIEKNEKKYSASILDLVSKSDLMTSTVAQSIRLQLKTNNILSVSDDVLQMNDAALINFLATQMVYKETNYVPIIYKLTNEQVTVRDQDIIIAISEAVTEEDEVLAYRNDEEIPFLLSEQAALNSTDIIIFVGVGENVREDINPIIIDNNIRKEEQEENISFRTHIQIDADRHQVKDGYRFDNQKYSKLRGWVVTFVPNTGGGFTTREWDSFWRPRGIHRGDIGESEIFLENEGAFFIDGADFSAGKSIFFGTYEHDWYANFKPISNSCSPQLHSVDVRMKFNNEFYFGHCGVASSIFPTVNSGSIFSNHKCMFDLERTQ